MSNTLKNKNQSLYLIIIIIKIWEFPRHKEYQKLYVTGDAYNDTWIESFSQD